MFLIIIHQRNLKLLSKSMFKSEPFFIIPPLTKITQIAIIYSKNDYNAHSHLWVGTVFSYIANLSNSIWFITKIYKINSWSVIYIIKCKLFLLNKCDSLWQFWSLFYLPPIINRGNFLSLFLSNHFWQIVGKLNGEEMSIGF